MIQPVLNLPRNAKKAIMLLFDSIALFFILLVSFYIRLGYWYFPESDIIWIFLGAPVLAVPIFVRFGLYLSVVRYIGFIALWSIAQAVTLYALLWGLICFMTGIDVPYLSEGIPRSIILINWMLSLLVIGGSRMFARWLLTTKSLLSGGGKNNVIVYGAGSAGRQLSNSLQQSTEYNHVYFVDDDPIIQDSYINSIPVVSASKLPSLIKEKEVSQVLLALPLISRKQRNDIIDRLSQLPVHVRSLPSVLDLAQGKVKIDDLREVDIKDLLGREPVVPNKKLLKIKISNKIVMVTGAGGSIGSELCRQILFLKPKKLILFEISESSLYKIDRELDDIGNSHIDILPILGSVRDKQRLEKICKHFGVQTIYHAAAYKHVPLVEYNNSEAVLNNTFGTKTVAEVAIATKVETFVLISTDKAVRPTNTMGATKRIAELLLQALSAQEHSTCFTTVRFGNVLDSSGSVIPLFKKQIKEGGPVTVTDINMVRYFMTIPEAVELVVQAGAMSDSGDIFVLDMGEPVRIYDLATRMIQLSDLQVLDNNNPDGDIEIKFIGLRPGEKLYEELLVGNHTTETDNPLIMRAEEDLPDWSTLKLVLDQLQEATKKLDQHKVRELLIKIVPDFKPQCDVSDLLYNLEKNL
jgi:FlaA1/EpsC-like NDP-sugar epimerase